MKVMNVKNHFKTALEQDKQHFKHLRSKKQLFCGNSWSKRQQFPACCITRLWEGEVSTKIQVYLSLKRCTDMGSCALQELRMHPHLQHYRKQQKYFPTWVPDAGRKKDVTKGKMQYADHLVRHLQAGWDLSYRNGTPTSLLARLPGSSRDAEKDLAIKRCCEIPWYLRGLT